jgi:hypothetical protein
MRRLLFLVACAVLALLAAAAPAAAAGGGAMPVPPPPPPHGAKLVMNVCERYANWEDNGNVGYWALNGAKQKVKVWQVTPGSFYLIAWYDGTWTTFEGVPSPNCSTEEGASFGLPLEEAEGTGPWGGWVAYTFQAADITRKYGYLGRFDDEGTVADVLLGYYYEPDGTTPLQVGSRHDADSMFLNYFIDVDWESFWPVGGCWVYRYKQQRMIQTYSPETGSTQTGNIVVTR